MCRAHFSQNRPECATLLACECYSDYREAPSQCRRMAGDEACARVAQSRPRLGGEIRAAVAERLRARRHEELSLGSANQKRDRRRESLQLLGVSLGGENLRPLGRGGSG